MYSVFHIKTIVFYQRQTDNRFENVYEKLTIQFTIDKFINRKNKIAQIK